MIIGLQEMKFFNFQGEIFMSKLFAWFFAMMAVLNSLGAYACTDIKLTAKDGTLMIGRSLEFGMDLNSNIRTSTRNRAFTNATPNGKSGLAWNAKYGYLYLDGFNQNMALDGINEAGLSFEYLYLPGETTYQTIPAGKENQGVPYNLFGDWVLSNFKSIDEVKAAVNNIYVFPLNLPGLGNVILPAHASITDATGKGIIVEFINGQKKVYDSIGVMTNSPQYNWQVTNLRNYVNLSAYNPASVIDGNMTFSSTGQGAGAVGLPGDYSPPSRFVKASYLLKTVYPANTATDILNLAQHIMNNFDIPAGASRTTDGGKTATDTTEWVVFKDLTHKVLYYRSYGDLTLRSIALDKLNFTANAPMLKMPVVNTQTPVDMTGTFLKSS